ncbi:hypothetical protein Hanom_Chr08g00714061 [Helianthus anomalus]
MVPANNANCALIVQADEICDWSVQLGNSGGGGYSGSSDEEGSSFGEDRSEDGAEVDDLITEAKSMYSKEATLEQKTEGSSDDFSKHLSEVGSSTLRATFMARLNCQSNQVSSNKHILFNCVECMVLKRKYIELEGKFDHIKNIIRV